MMDRIARVEALRRRATDYESMADETTSIKFRNCYRLLAKQFGTMAQIEEQYVAGSEGLKAVQKRK